MRMSPTKLYFSQYKPLVARFDMLTAAPDSTARRSQLATLRSDTETLLRVIDANASEHHIDLYVEARALINCIDELN